MMMAEDSAEERKRKRLEAWKRRRQQQEVPTGSLHPPPPPPPPKPVIKVSMSIGGKKKRDVNKKQNIQPSAKPLNAFDNVDDDDDDSDEEFGKRGKLSLGLGFTLTDNDGSARDDEDEGSRSPPSKRRKKGRWDKKEELKKAVPSPDRAPVGDALDKFMEKLEAGAMGSVTTQVSEASGTEILSIDVGGSMMRVPKLKKIDHVATSMSGGVITADEVSNLGKSKSKAKAASTDALYTASDWESDATGGGASESETDDEEEEKARRAFIEALKCIGSHTDAGKTSFANKSMQQLGDEIDPTSCGLGYTCRKGLKPESPNQDSWFVLKMESCSIYAVFDGHGQKGHDVSNFVKDALPKLIIKDPRFKTAELPALLKDVFRKTQSLVGTADRMKKLSAQMSGTTATVCVHDHLNNKVTLAHVADSTAVLGRSKGSKGSKADVEGIALTRDHKPNLKDERARIEKAGGRVVFDGYANHRIYAKNARYPGLNMSRCIGDLMGHAECGITCEPEVVERDLQPEDTHLMLCSDGVWEFTSPTEAVEIVSEFPAPKAMTAAERLAKEAWDRWIREEGGAVVDDITVVLVYLQLGRMT